MRVFTGLCVLFYWSTIVTPLMSVVTISFLTSGRFLGVSQSVATYYGSVRQRVRELAVQRVYISISRRHRQVRKLVLILSYKVVTCQ